MIESLLRWLRVRDAPVIDVEEIVRNDPGLQKIGQAKKRVEEINRRLDRRQRRIGLSSADMIRGGRRHRPHVPS